MCAPCWSGNPRPQPRQQTQGPHLDCNAATTRGRSTAVRLHAPALQARCLEYLGARAAAAQLTVRLGLLPNTCIALRRPSPLCHAGHSSISSSRSLPPPLPLPPHFPPCMSGGPLVLLPVGFSCRVPASQAVFSALCPTGQTANSQGNAEGVQATGCASLFPPPGLARHLHSSAHQSRLITDRLY